MRVYIIAAPSPPRSKPANNHDFLLCTPLHKRKNALFAGHEVGEENWALLASLIANCKMCDVDPISYMTNTLQALLDGRPKSRTDGLMPWHFDVASSRTA